MDTSPISAAMNRQKAISSKAFEKARVMAGVDVDLQLYERLKPEDFESLVQRFGPDNIVQYIKTMEARRQGVKNGG